METTQTSEIERAIYAAIDEATREPVEPGGPGRTPDTVLVGDDPLLDSMTFVMFALNLEKELDRRYGETISVMDLIAAGEQLTVEALARRIARRLGPRGE
ncbi:MAG: hypothetical protein D6718_09755 [Acidobacteria bacterium]|nr:MAG: hypothetical protein D6718_09755 [Acidobacteriota bacterium]